MGLTSAKHIRLCTKFVIEETAEKFRGNNFITVMVDSGTDEGVIEEVQPKSGTSADVLDANSVAMSSSTEWGAVCGGRS